MGLKRVCLPTPLAAHSQVVAEGDRAHYLGRVLRMRPGDPLQVFDGGGDEFAATVAEVGRARVTLQVGAPVSPLPESPLHITLALGVSRGERMDTAIQKAVELGVARIAPVLTARGAVRLDGDRAQRRRARWREVVVSACEQCGRSVLPSVEVPVPLERWLAGRQAGLRLVLNPHAGTPVRELSWDGEGVTLLVGPEGGLDAAETAAAQGAGYLGVALGPRVLRTETAPLAAVAVLQARWGDLGG